MSCWRGRRCSSVEEFRGGGDFGGLESGDRISWFRVAIFGRHGTGNGFGSDSALECGRIPARSYGLWYGSSLGVIGSLRTRTI